MDLPPAPPHRVPPRFVPTLTEVVQWPATTVAEAPDLAVSGPHGDRSTQEDLREAMMHRLMQRVDDALTPALRNAVAELVVTHLQLLEPLLREEIETIVRAAVRDALNQELDSRKD